MNESPAGIPATTPASAQPDRIPTEPAPAAPRRSRSGTALNVALGLALVVAVAGVAFAAGRATAPAAAFPDGGAFLGRGPLGSFDPGANPGGNPGTNPGGFGGVAIGGGSVALSGTVVTVDADSLTIRTAAGETVEIALDGSTTYHAQTDAVRDDVVTGETVLVRVDIAAGRAGGGATRATASDVTVVP